MLSSNNLLKGSWIQVQSDDTRVINNNELVEKRLHGGGLQKSARDEASGRELTEGNEKAQEGFRSGLYAEELQPEELEGLLANPEDESTLIKAHMEEAVPEPPQPVYDGPSPEELIEQAQEEIRQMREDAQQEIAQLRRQEAETGRKEGKSQGYRDGKAEAQKELDAAKDQLEAAYQQKLHEMEPEMVKQLTGIYEHIFHVELATYQGLVMQLLESCMQKIENSSDYIVHVSPDDYPFVSMQKNRLVETMGSKNATLEIVEDATMKKNECMVEADSGIYDCSLDVQLDALRRQLLLLSYGGV